MNAKEILDLHKQGWTKEEIQALIKSETETPNAATPAVKTEQAAQAPAKPEAKPEAHSEPKAAEPAKNVYQLTDEQLQQLAQKMAVKAAGGVFETPKDVGTVLGEHLQSILKGE